LEREGEFNEWEDERTLSFGGFGLNYAAVGFIRENALDFLEFALQGEGLASFRAVELLKRLLHNFLNRVGRVTTDHEKDWQNRERSRCLEMLGVCRE
jgi:hypothetical protein